MEEEGREERRVRGEKEDAGGYMNAVLPISHH